MVVGPDVRADELRPGADGHVAAGEDVAVGAAVWGSPVRRGRVRDRVGEVSGVVEGEFIRGIICLAV